MNYRITEVSGWIIVTPTGRAENNEPLRVKYLFKRWLSGNNARVIVNLKELQQLGVWEMGLLTSLKREIDQRAGIIRLCHLNPALAGYFHDDRFAEQFAIFSDLEGAMQAGRNTSNE
jgi:anti-anti-sigma regulatory factor